MTAASIDLRELAVDLTKAGDSMEKVAADLIVQVAQQVQQYAQAEAPRKTGQLAMSIRVSWVDRLTADIGPTVPYGVYQEFGTGTRSEFGGEMYEIRPKNKPFLIFKVNGKTVAAKVVHHPGVPPRPYMRPAAVQAVQPFAGRLAEKGQLMIVKGPRSAL